MLDIRENEPLAPLTTFNIGGPARYFVLARTREDVREAVRWATERSLRFIFFAGGSNVLVPDRGLDVLVIAVASKEAVWNGTTLTADAGCDLLTLIGQGAQKGVGGWERLAGIPGTLGGAVRGNAGAFGSEIKDFIRQVEALDTRTGSEKEFSREECDFAYRHSFFKDNPEWLILNATLTLQPVAPEESESRAEETIREREKRHLQNVQAAGSYFMNPVVPPEVQNMFEKEKGVASREGRVPAGWLIEKAGMKGVTVGGAIASLQHPNYIVNTGNATAADVLALAERIKKAVREMFGVELKEEAAVLA